MQESPSSLLTGTDACEEETVIVSGTTSPVVTIVPERFYDGAKRCWVDCYLDGRSYQIETNAGFFMAAPLDEENVSCPEMVRKVQQ